MTKIQTGIVTFKRETAPNAYADEVAALIAATNENPDAAYALLVPAGEKKDGSPAEGQPSIVQFQKAARAAGYTARVRANEDQGDGNALVTFQLTQLNKSRRGGDSASVEESVKADTEAPAE